MSTLRDHVFAAARRDEVREAVARVYADLQREIDARKPVCSASGRCCRFEEFGHRLYVTTIELAAFVARLPAELPLPDAPGSVFDGGSGAAGVPREQPADSSNSAQAPERAPPDAMRVSPLSPEYRGEGASGDCPFQVEGLCSVHAIRPFGCRVFFCDASSDEWQHQQYERFHGGLKRLHEQFGVPYRYLEWREALRQLDLHDRSLQRGSSPAVSPTDDASSHAPAGKNPSASAAGRLSLPQLRL